MSVPGRDKKCDRVCMSIIPSGRDKKCDRVYVCMYVNNPVLMLGSLIKASMWCMYLLIVNIEIDNTNST